MKNIIKVQTYWLAGLTLLMGFQVAYVASLKNSVKAQVEESLAEKEKAAIQPIFDKISRGRALLDLDPISPPPETYGDVLNIIFDTSNAMIEPMQDNE